VMLRASNLTVRGGRRALLDSVTVSFAPGELTALVGPNGAGKTTLLRCLDGELQPAAGGVALGGRALAVTVMVTVTASVTVASMVAVNSARNFCCLTNPSPRSTCVTNIDCSTC